MSSKKKLTSLSINEKLNIIKEIEEDKKSKKAICLKYKCDISTVNRILRKKIEIFEAKSRFNNLKRKRNRKGAHDSVEKALRTWFTKQRQNNAAINSLVLIRKAKEFAIKFGDDFEPDSTWLFRWKKRHNIKLEAINGQSSLAHPDRTQNCNDVLPDMICAPETVMGVETIKRELVDGEVSVSNVDYSQYCTGVFPDLIEVCSTGNRMEADDIKLGVTHEDVSLNNEHSTQNYINNILPGLINGYASDNIMNAHETILFYKALPTNSYYQPDNQAFGDKGQKVKFTLLFICNATATFKRVFVIGKSKNPLYLKNAVSPVPYFFNKSALMTTTLWQDILHSLDIEMQKLNKKIILFVDNASFHKTPDLSNIVVQFLPSNITSSIQPLDQGIISSFKAYYRQIIDRKHISALERNMTIKEFYKSISSVDALHFIKRAWWLVPPSCISSCFEKFRFDSKTLENHMDGTAKDDFVNAFPDRMVRMHCNADVETLNGDFNGSNIAENFIKIDPENDNESASDTQEDEDVNRVPSLKEALIALNVLQKYCYLNNIDISLDAIETEILKARVNRLDR